MKNSDTNGMKDGLISRFVTGEEAPTPLIVRRMNEDELCDGF